MYEGIIKIRNSLIRYPYKYLAKPLFFMINPETMHDIATISGRILGSNPLTRGIVRLKFGYKNNMLKQKVLGINFDNPVGLAAGFDKDAHLVNIMPSVGMGFETIGSVTGEKCEGNPKPRLWRLKKSKGLIVYYGLKNDGCEIIAKRLKKKKHKIPIGTSIAKTNSKDTIELKAGIADYFKAMKELRDIGDYNVINISCPNTFGGEPFVKPKRLNALLNETDKIKTKKPTFIKMSPDLTKRELDDVLKVCGKHKIQGFICSNLVKKRDTIKIIEKEIPNKGGISGKPVKNKSLDQINYIYKKTKGKYILIGCGGISNAQDAYDKIKAGATLVEMITGMIFEGPQVISEINQGLVSLLKKEGYNNISEAIGSNHK